MASALLGGTATVTIDGQPYSGTEIEWDTASIDRQPIKALNGVGQYYEAYTAPYISLTLLDNGAVPVAALNGLVNASIVVTLASKKVIQGNNMYQSGGLSVSVGENPTYTVRFYGLSLTSVLEITTT